MSYKCTAKRGTIGAKLYGQVAKISACRSISVEPDKIFHATVMPCFDKKLEASRPQFANKCREVDCVLSTGEHL